MIRHLFLERSRSISRDVYLPKGWATFRLNQYFCRTSWFNCVLEFTIKFIKSHLLPTSREKLKVVMFLWIRFHDIIYVIVMQYQPLNLHIPKCRVKRAFIGAQGNKRIYSLTCLHMSHFAYACKMRYPLNLVLENIEYLWFYWTFCIVILDYGLKLHNLSIRTLVMLQKWLEIH